MHAFLSYNHADEETSRGLGVQLKLVGADVWFDQWEIRAGDSIPGKLDEGLSTFDTFILLWSRHAEKSGWVRRELEVAIQRGIDNPHTRIIPVRLDFTELPVLLRPLKRLDIFTPHAINEAVVEIMGFASDRERVRAIQAVLESAKVKIDFFHGYGPTVGCPRCGAGLEAIEGWNQTDYKRGDTYAGARCKECGWHDGGEV